MIDTTVESNIVIQNTESLERVNVLDVKHLSTGLESVDKLFDGGFPCGKFIEMHGAPGVGQTLFALQVARGIIENTNRSVAYIDSAFALTPSQLRNSLKDNLSKRL